uniref:lysylphosphatidylglycerol synthase domain-containing protein n=1 Tax=uncultured Erythrobacter sp. TaxID=263913 RepID=UPI0026161920|nr:lysylphosphatidylglycerol synthase domain-containing protein [uncultured Erythrobacter sp.]
MTHPETSEVAPINGGAAWKSYARAAFCIAALAAAGVLLASEWDGISTALAKADYGLIALAFLAAMINIVLTGLSWRALLARAPVNLSLRRSAYVFFLGQIGKYLPGTVWSFLASGELAKRTGFPRAAAMSSLLLALLIGVGSGVIIALLLVPQTLGYLPESWIVWVIGAAAALPLALPKVRAYLLRLARIDFPVTVGTLALSMALALIAWIFAGAQIVLLSQAIDGALGWSDLPQAIGAYAFAWVAGFLVIIAPAGLGAREGGLIAALSLSMGLVEASAIVLLSRLVVTAADFACAGIAAAMNPDQAAQANAQHPHQG